LFQAQSAIEVLDCVVALTSGALQTFTVDDSDRATEVLNQTCTLQNSGGNGHSGASSAQHFAEELMGERQQLAVNPVLAHQQPARQPFIDLMKPVAGGDLRHLQSLNQCVTTQFQMQTGGGAQNVFKHSGLYS